MQKRHSDRRQYFLELANTSRDYYIDYITPFKEITPRTLILEIGCGEGGNLLPFAEKGCKVKGLDISPLRIEQARSFFEELSIPADLTCTDFLQMPAPENDTDKYDIILMHDVIEHIEHPLKRVFITHMKKFVKSDGLLFIAFPAWQMPFGGHQQICHSKLCATLPFMHLLPMSWYRSYLKRFGEGESCIDELMSIKRSKMTIETFEFLCREAGLKVLDRTLWFINPHYKQKFGLPALKLRAPLSTLYYVRNFLSTSCFYLLSPG